MADPLIAHRAPARRSAHDVLAGSRALVEPALKAVVQELPASMRQVVGYHFGWWDVRGAPTVGGGGKAIRPALTLVTAEAVGGDPGAAVPAAVAVELVHNFSLVHDDLIDDDATRRNRPTAWVVFGRPQALLAGNALLSLAFEVLATCDNPQAREAARMLGAAVQHMLDGQHRDMAFERRSDVGVDECLVMAERKTGALFGAACGLGALFGGASPSLVAYADAFGRRLGLAFQFVDDLLGIWGDPALTGKSVYSDLASRKKSLTVVAALTSGTAPGEKLRALLAREGDLAAADLARAAELVELAGGREWSRTEVHKLLVELLDELESLALSERAAGELAELARLVTWRDR